MTYADVHFVLLVRVHVGRRSAGSSGFGMQMTWAGGDEGSCSRSRGLGVVFICLLSVSARHRMNSAYVVALVGLLDRDKGRVNNVLSLWAPSAAPMRLGGWILVGRA